MIEDCHSTFAIGNVFWRCELSEGHCGLHYSHAETPAEVGLAGILPNRRPITRAHLVWDLSTVSLSFA